MATPEEPMLASTVYHVFNDRTRLAKVRLKTTCSPIDDALRGGIDYGRVSCISGEKGTGKSTVSYSNVAYFNQLCASFATIHIFFLFSVLTFYL